jgi:N utilization substance protein B
MLNRRILRIKAFKVLYSYAENQSMTLEEAESQLGESLEATRTLYLFMLDLIPALTQEARRRIEESASKFNPTEEERHPNMKFAQNQIAPLLSEDPDFQKIISRRGLSWEQQDAFLRKLYDTVRTREYFTEYMAAPERSVKEDAALFTKIFEEELVDDEDLEKILEDMSLWWIDDLAYSLTWCCNAMKDFAAGRRWTLPELYKSDMMKSEHNKAQQKVDSDKNFVFKLLRTSYANYENYMKRIAEMVPDWDDNRLFTTDIVLIVMGISEAKAFTSMPIRVTINEYVEISKFYSTPKSRQFVNGLLDKLIKKLIEEGEIMKTAEN